MSEKGIKISPKHGLNPTMGVCFFCGEPKEIALFGKLKNDEKAPERLVLDYEPCDKCREQMEQGVTFIGVTFEPNQDGQPPITENNEQKLYPTGAFMVVRDEAVERLLPGDEIKDMREDTLKKRKAFVEGCILKSWSDAYAKLNDSETPDEPDDENSNTD